MHILNNLQIDNKKFNFRGFSPVLSGHNDGESAGDYHEGFEFGFEDISKQASGAREVDGAMAGANVWPTQVPGFREALLTY